MTKTINKLKNYLRNWKLQNI